MYADRYARKPVDRSSLTLSVGIVGGLLAAAMLSPTVVSIVRHDRDLTTYAVPPPAPPPPPDVRPNVEPKVQPRETQVSAPDVIVPTPTFDDIHVTPPDPGPPPVPEGTGNGEAVVVDPPKPPPVILGAQPDPRVDFQPTYPAEERRAGNEGVVTLKVLVGVDGRVRQVEKVAAASDAFWRVTQDRALRAWRFKPATRDGVPYETWRTMTVRFRLEAE